MLSAVFASDGYAENYRHLKKSRAHRLPLGELIEYFVSCATDEVGIHKLNYSATACHCVTDSRTYDCGFGDRGIEQSVIGKRFCETAVNGKRSAPISIILAVSDERGILVEFINDCFKDAVSYAVLLDLGKQFALFVICVAGKRSDLLNARIFFLGHKNVGSAAFVHALNVLI